MAGRSSPNSNSNSVSRYWSATPSMMGGSAVRRHEPLPCTGVLRPSLGLWTDFNQKDRPGRQWWNVHSPLMLPTEGRSWRTRSKRRIAGDGLTRPK
jgi:hypothetical protein